MSAVTRRIAGSRFRAARVADLAKLGSYERQDGQAGLEETFAESGARFIAGEPGFPGDWPALHAFWLQGLHANGRPEMEPSPPAAGVALGTAELLDDGAIELGAESEKRGRSATHFSESGSRTPLMTRYRGTSMERKKPKPYR